MAINFFSNLNFLVFLGIKFETHLCHFCLFSVPPWAQLGLQIHGFYAQFKVNPYPTVGFLRYPQIISIFPNSSHTPGNCIRRIKNVLSFLNSFVDNRSILKNYDWPFLLWQQKSKLIICQWFRYNPNFGFEWSMKKLISSWKSKWVPWKY